MNIRSVIADIKQTWQDEEKKLQEELDKLKKKIDDTDPRKQPDDGKGGAGPVTPPVDPVKPPVVVDPEKPHDDVVPDPTLVRGAMFFPASSAFPWANCRGVSSPQGYASSHGKSDENPYRTYCFGAIKAMGGNALAYILDKWMRNQPVLQMCLCDREHPDDKHHFPKAGAEPNWALIAQEDYDIGTHLVAFRDSPDTGVGVSEQAVIEAVQCYTGSRVKQIVWLTGLETDRNNGATPDQTAQIVAWFKAHKRPQDRVAVGSQSLGYLLDVASKCDAELWLEQATHPINAPLTFDSAKAYLASLDQLAAQVGAAKTWAGEWWAGDEATRKNITAQIVAKGMQCGCGEW